MATSSSGVAGSAPFDRRRLALAFTLTPLLPAFYPAIFLAEPWAIPAGLALAYPSALLFGLPLGLLFKRMCWRKWWQFALGGAACALPSVVLYALIGTPAHFQRFGSLPALGLLFIGACSGAAFWLLGVAGETPVTLRSLFDPIRTRH